MATRKPLEAGDDGSGNVYPVREPVTTPDYVTSGLEEWTELAFTRLAATPASAARSYTLYRIASPEGVKRYTVWFGSVSCDSYDNYEDARRAYTSVVRSSGLPPVRCGCSPDCPYEADGGCPPDCPYEADVEDVTAEEIHAAEQEVPATEPAYRLVFAVDGDEIVLPFKAYSGRDYEPFQDLRDLAWKYCNALRSVYEAATSFRCTIFPEGGVGVLSCDGDYDPLPVVDVALECDPKGDPDSGRDDS